MRALRLIDLEREVHSALQIEPALQRNTLDGVVDVKPFGPRTRSTTLRGKRAKNDAAISPAISRTRYFRFMRLTG